MLRSKRSAKREASAKAAALFAVVGRGDGRVAELEAELPSTDEAGDLCELGERKGETTRTHLFQLMTCSSVVVSAANPDE